MSVVSGLKLYYRDYINYDDDIIKKHFKNYCDIVNEYYDDMEDINPEEYYDKVLSIVHMLVEKNNEPDNYLDSYIDDISGDRSLNISAKHNDWQEENIIYLVFSFPNS